MLRTKTKNTGIPPKNESPSASNDGGAGGGGGAWELRPGGMLVQKRNPDMEKASATAPKIRVRVKYCSIYHEISISSQATFGELKKMLVGPTGLHHLDQKLIYKDKERDSKAFLDISGIKDKSKVLLVEDPISQEKRILEMRKNAKMEKASKTISGISLEVDRLAGQVSALESVISKGGKVAEKTVLNLIELLMDQLLKLDGIMGEGDVKLQRKMQVKRVQKYVETLDMLKIKNSTTTTNENQIPLQVEQNKSNEPKQVHDHLQQPKLSNGHKQPPVYENQPRHPLGHSPIHPEPPSTSPLAPASAPAQALPLLEHHQHSPPQEAERNSTSGTVVTTKWEIFDTMPPLVPTSSAQVQPRFNWEFFD